MFDTLLIANRGEIAVRVIRTARRLGIRTIAVYSDADAHAMHVQMADEAHRLGPPAAAESYLLGDRIIEIAKRRGAQAIHPGYGFLSENASFSRACEEAGIAFVGPKPATIEAMGSKARAKQLMQGAGVPLLPGYQGEEQSLEVFRAEAERIGYPVLLKAAAGGGGKGMRIVEDPADLEGELESARREAISAFGDGRFIVEKFLPAPRHVEVQVFGDTHGNIVHLFERDCSVQRRYQKVIEEAPAPNLPGVVRDELHRAAVDAARAVDYVGAGTVEFLYDGDQGVYFMEMNTRLQVEHPVTEEVTGLDLVEWQLRVAHGEPLPARQDEIDCCGHAIEARLYAEDPDENYLPQTGRLHAFSVGHVFDMDDLHLRVDTGVGAGSEITPFYDPMIAKVIVAAEDRESAAAGLAAHLDTAEISGLTTNRDQLVAILRHEGFLGSAPTTKFLTQHEVTGGRVPSDGEMVAAACALALDSVPGASMRPGSMGLGFRLNGPETFRTTFIRDGAPVAVTILHDESGWQAQVGDEVLAFAVVESGDEMVEPPSIAIGDALFPLARIPGRGAGEVGLVLGERTVWLSLHDPFTGAGSAGADAVALSSPIPATVTGVKVDVGERVATGQTLVTLEAMKMETVIKAPHDGEVTALHFTEGDSVPKGALLLDLSEA